MKREKAERREEERSAMGKGKISLCNPVFAGQNGGECWREPFQTFSLLFRAFQYLFTRKSDINKLVINDLRQNLFT